MKLYTEEQVKAMIEKSQYTGLTADYLLLANNPIELPSDDEIYERAFQQWGDYSKTSHQNTYLEGAKWMRDKIQGGNK
jgi:hypothetical protein